MLYLCVGLVVVVGALSGYAILKWQYAKALLAQSEHLRQKIEQEMRELDSTLRQKAQEIATLYAKLESANERIQDKQKELEEVKTQNAIALEKIQAQYKQSLDQLKEESEKNFQIQKNAMLDQNRLMLTKDSRQMLEEIFNPLKTHIEEYQKHLLQNEASLKQNIDNVFKYSQEMSKNAEALGRILRGDKKIRGNFGELQLKNVLQNSGLIEGEQYKLQAHFKDEGKSFAPDAVVRLDTTRSIIIDAKFPLPNELDSVLTTGEIDSSISYQIAKNLRQRIDELAKKPYANFDENTFDFVLLFVPYNNLLDLALLGDSGLYQYAYNHQVYLTTPQTLFMALKTISITWVHIESDSKIHKAFEEIGKFYNKFVSVCEDFDKLNRALDSAMRACADMDTKLRGRGGLESKFELLKTLGAKTNKTIPKGRGIASLAQEQDKPSEVES